MRKSFAVLFTLSLLALAALLTSCGSSSQKSAEAEKKPAETTAPQPAQPPSPVPAPTPTQANTSEPAKPANAPPLPPFKAHLDAKAHVILTAAAEAYGGLTQPLEVHDLVILGKTSAAAPGSDQKMALDMTIYLKEPNKLRMSTSGPNGQQIVMGFDGKAGWAQLLMGTQALATRDLPSGKIQEFRAQLQSLTRLDNPFFEALLQENYIFKFIETTSLEAGPADLVEFTPPQGKATKIYIDQRSHDMVKSEQTTDKEKVETLFGDFRVVAGRRTPFDIKTIANGKLAAEMQIVEMKVNTGLDDSLFAKPVSK